MSASSLADLTDEVAKARAIGRAGSRPSEIVVDHDDIAKPVVSRQLCESVLPTLTLEIRAAEKIADDLPLRLEVRTVPNAPGFEYNLVFDDRRKPGDQELDANGIKVVLDPSSLNAGQFARLLVEVGRFRA